MPVVDLSLLRGVCQMPGYVALAKGFFQAEGIDVRVRIEPTAWLIPDRMVAGTVQFAVMPWTRVAAANVRNEPLVLVCGSGCEEAAIVVRHGLAVGDVRSVAVPQEGGIKDLTAQALMASLGWETAEVHRLPSGDGAILALVGQGADAASMVEPYATMLEQLGIGTVVRRTGDVWPGAPGCSLTTTHAMIQADPDLVRRMVAAFARGAEYVEAEPDESAAIAGRYIGMNPAFVRRSLNCCRPNVHALGNETAVGEVLGLMRKLGYIERLPTPDFYDRSFLGEALKADAAR